MSITPNCKSDLPMFKNVPAEIRMFKKPKLSRRESSAKSNGAWMGLDKSEFDEFDEDIVTELRSRASDYLLTQAIMTEEVLENNKPEDDLLAMEGMDDVLANALAVKGVCTMEDLAELAVDEVMEIEGMDEERAAALIMTARAPWFETEEQ